MFFFSICFITKVFDYNENGVKCVVGLEIVTAKLSTNFSSLFDSIVLIIFGGKFAQFKA